MKFNRQANECFELGDESNKYPTIECFYSECWQYKITLVKHSGGGESILVYHRYNYSGKNKGWLPLNGLLTTGNFNDGVKVCEEHEHEKFLEKI